MEPLRRTTLTKSTTGTLPCREWGCLAVGQGGLTENEAERLHALAKRSARRLRLPETAVLTRTYRGLKAGQVVGIMSIPGRTVEILPKIDGNDGAVRAALVRMLAVAWGLRVAEGELTTLHTQRHDLLELLIRLFADRLLAAVRRGMPRRYLMHEEDLALLRGRFDIKRQFTRLVVRPDRLACRYDELSEDTPLNRVFKATVMRLTGVARSAANSRRLTELTARFEFVRDSSDPLREPVRLDRTNVAFHDLHRLAKLFLTGDWQSTAGGRSAGFALLFPMDKLFEAFIGRSLERALAPRTVRLQHKSRYALTSADGKLHVFALQPDAVIEESDGRPIILDTKWKRLTPRKPRCTETLGVSESDIYQMLAYARAYDAGRLVLIYPWHEEMDAEQGVIRRWTVTESDCRVDVVTVDVGSPGEVRKILREHLRVRDVMRLRCPSGPARSPERDCPPRKVIEL